MRWHKKIDGYITEHIQEPLSVPVLCKAFSISKSHLYKLSEQNFGMGIAEYIRSLRIQMAKRLLGDTDSPIYEIAEQVGIPDYNYFTKAFKKRSPAHCPASTAKKTLYKDALRADSDGSWLKAYTAEIAASGTSLLLSPPASSSSALLCADLIIPSLDQK
ncbi:helix-turn-helix transcriptional regulator [Paenibacillus rhizoplanae]